MNLRRFNLHFVCVLFFISCNHHVEKKSSLLSGYEKFQSFDMVSLKGIGTPDKRPFVYVKACDDSILIRISNNTTKKLEFTKEKNCWKASRLAVIGNDSINIHYYNSNDTLYVYEFRYSKGKIWWPTLEICTSNKVFDYDVSDQMLKGVYDKAIPSFKEIKAMFAAAKKSMKPDESIVAYTEYGRILYIRNLQKGHEIINWPLGLLDDAERYRRSLFMETFEYYGSLDSLKKHPDFDTTLINDLHSHTTRL